MEGEFTRLVNLAIVKSYHSLMIQSVFVSLSEEANVARVFRGIKTWLCKRAVNKTSVATSRQ